MKQVLVPGSKSVSCRALVLASITSGPTTLQNLLRCDDTQILQDALESFGVRFAWKGKDLEITPPKKLTAHGQEIFVGNAGTPARFLSALSLLIQGTFALEGTSRMGERPMKELFEVLENMGVRIQHEKGFLPATFSSSVSSIQSIEMSSTVSSQFLSALLLVGAKLAPFEIKLTQPLTSRSYIQMTIDMLKVWGIDVQNKGFKTFTITGKLTSPDTFVIPSDCSAMTYPIAYSLLSKTPIQIHKLPHQTFQGDENFLFIAEQFGARILRSESMIEVHPPQTLRGLGERDFSNMLDTVPTACILAAVAKGETFITNIGNLRYKESNRIESIVQNLKSLGVGVEAGENWIQIRPLPQPLSQRERGVIKTHDDHRIAMAFGVLSEALGLHLKIDNTDCVSKSWPEFWLELADWAGKMRNVGASIVERFPHPAPLPRGEGEKSILSPSGRELERGETRKMHPEMLERVRELRKNQTDAENILWMVLRNKNLEGIKFRRQHNVGTYILDFYCHEYKLAIELDGGGHVESKQKKYDEERDKFLNKEGIRVLRIWNNDVMQNLEGVVEEILNSLTPPLSQGEREFLIVKKPRKHHAWQFPQGGVDRGETLLEGAQRELREECGEDLEVKFHPDPLGSYAYFFPKDFRRYKEGVTIGAKVAFFRAEFLDGEIELEREELEDYKWVKKEELGNYLEGEYLEVVLSLL